MYRVSDGTPGSFTITESSHDERVTMSRTVRLLCDPERPSTLSKPGDIEPRKLAGNGPAIPCWDGNAACCRPEEVNVIGAKGVNNTVTQTPVPCLPVLTLTTPPIRKVGKHVRP
ncbi:hypothetical protein VTK26DRAFT_6029 [Humicola hyalothermophila]